MLLSLAEVCLCTRILYSGAKADTEYGSVGPGGYVAAIKAAQLGLRVSKLLSRLRLFSYFFLRADGVYREERFSRWNLPECRVHSLEGHVKQFAHLPPDKT